MGDDSHEINLLRKRVEQLEARYTRVLEALDSSVSLLQEVKPAVAACHDLLVEYAGIQATHTREIEELQIKTSHTPYPL